MSGRQATLHKFVAGLPAHSSAQPPAQALGVHGTTSKINQDADIARNSFLAIHTEHQRHEATIEERDREFKKSEKQRQELEKKTNEIYEKYKDSLQAYSELASSSDVTTLRAANVRLGLKLSKAEQKIEELQREIENLRAGSSSSNNTTNTTAITTITDHPIPRAGPPSPDPETTACGEIGEEGEEEGGEAGQEEEKEEKSAGVKRKRGFEEEVENVFNVECYPSLEEEFFKVLEEGCAEMYGI
ncbi:uncharacterized protein IWZ02DRAFT_431246 [Phyllosticta citriasiana]|uniref:uncharacterized protein n=1 Tax=Phyllosticta citriasiana TaxID=595635 RepID=UPI0030FD95DF